VSSLFDSEGTAHADNEKDEHPDELGGPKKDHSHVVIVHRPHAILREGGLHGGVASKGVWREEHSPTGNQDGKL